MVLSGDVPLVGAEAIAELVAAHADGGFRRRWRRRCSRTRAATAASCATPTGAVERVVETKRPGDSTQAEREIHEVNTGIFVFAAEALAQALPRLSADNAQGELYLPQVLELLSADGGDRRRPRDRRPGARARRQRPRGARARARARPGGIHERHMDAGVSVVDPRATVIDVDVEIGEDTVIEPFTTIRGATRIGRGCTIRHSYLVDCVLEDGVSVGPFAYLRPGSVLRSGSKVGTFVEVKNSDVGAGAKVPHLSYIGDADVGEGTNLGAATITANYDGHAKHRTKVGDRVRTGVDTTLVAPVTVGDDAYTGAGSVITEDVPPGALGIARERQQNLEGYAERGPRTREEDPDEYAERPPALAERCRPDLYTPW